MSGADEKTLESARESLAKDARGPAAHHLNACVRCGLCAQSCHFYLAESESENHPAVKAGHVSALFRRYHTFLGRLLPALAGARDISPESMAELADACFGRCTACGRCAIHCAIGLDVTAVIRTGRRMLAAAGQTPEGLRQTLANQITTGNQMAIPRDEFISTLQWLTENLRDEMNDPSVSIPLDAPGHRVLYLVNPREVKFFPLSLMAAAGIFHAAGESWTLSSRCYDVTNYGLFAGNDAGAAELVRRAVDEAAALQVEEIVLSECGHGFRALRWEGPNWLGRRYSLPVRSVLELLDEYLASGRIEVEPARNSARVTLHDPCNLVRWGGISEPQRRVLRSVAADFVEMTPNRVDNFCCGGGGGMLSMSEYGERRVRSGRIKADQIRATGAKIVAAPCHNCADQLLEITKRYKLGIEVQSITELVYNALIAPAAAP